MTRGERRAADESLYASLETCLPSDGAVRFLDGHHMGNPFQPAELSEIRRFCACWAARGHEFHDRKLERLRRRLLRSGEEYLRAVDELTEVGPEGLRSVPRVWLYEDATRFDFAAYRLNKLAARVVRCYGELNNAAHRRLPVTARA